MSACRTTSRTASGRYAALVRARDIVLFARCRQAFDELVNLRETIVLFRGDADGPHVIAAEPTLPKVCVTGTSDARGGRLVAYRSVCSSNAS